MDVDGEVGGGTGNWCHEQLSLRMALAAATHHSAQPRAQEGVEGETFDAPRRPKPSPPGKRPAPLEKVTEPQEKLGQHSGNGYELDLALDAPVLHMVEQPVDVLVRVDDLLKKQEEEEEEVRRWRRTPMNRCRALESTPGSRPQLYADNLKCVSGSLAALLSAARFTSMYICLVGQEAAPNKCVFLSTSKKVRNDMKCCAVSDTGDKWRDRLDVGDLGGHLDSTFLG